MSERCAGCGHWRPIHYNKLGDYICYFSQDTGRVRLQSPEECTHYTPRQGTKPAARVLKSDFRNYEDRRNSLARLERLRQHLKPDVYRNIRAQIVRGELVEAARGMDKVERRIERKGL